MAAAPHTTAALLRRTSLGVGLAPLMATLLAGCPVTPIVPAGSPADDPATAAAMRRLSPLPPLPPDPTNRWADDDRAARLGHRLFFDTRLSRNGQVACASCHQPDKAFSDGRDIAVGLEKGSRNTPSLLNAAYQHWQGWAGKADSVWLQSLNALEDPREQGAKRLGVAHRLQEAYKDLYEPVFGALPPAGLPADGHPGEPAFDTLTPEQQEQVNRAVVNVGKALGAYVRKLVTGPSAFDRYVAGDTSALSAEARQGLALFTGKSGCISCHSGPLFSDGDFHNLGVPAATGLPDDAGRLVDLPAVLANPRNAQSRWSDAPNAFPAPDTQVGETQRHQFKTPSLRNVALTAPYWHNGTGATVLESVVAFESAGGAKGIGILDPKLTPHTLAYSDSKALKAFLDTLTGTPVPAPWGQAPAWTPEWPDKP